MTNSGFSPDKGFYTVKEFCLWAGIGNTTFYKLVGEGKIKTAKIGSKTLVAYPEAMRFAENISGEACNDNGFT